MLMERIITFKVDDTTISKLNELARIYGVSRSELIRKAINDMLNNKNKEKCLKEIMRQETIDELKRICKNNYNCILAIIRIIIEEGLYLLIRSMSMLKDFD